MYNSGFRTNKKTPDGVGTVASQAAFVQKSDPSPTILSWSVQGSDDRALDPAGGQTVVVNGAGFTSGMTVTVGVTAIGSVTIVNSTQATFTAPAKAAGNYTLTMANSNGQAAILVPGLAYSTVVTWTTPAGSIGSTVETTAFTESVVATADSSITYALASGTLPTGATLNGNGTITGTAVTTASPTTYSFSIIATDAELQDSTQSFTITVNPDSVTWASPANGTSYSLTGNQPMSNVTLSATAASGSGVAYAANTLPTGVSLTGNVIYGTPTVAQTVSTLLTATANTTTRSSTETITWVVTIGDIYWPYVSLLLNGATPTPSFINDASLNNAQLTVVNDTKPNLFSPYEDGYYSNYFNGSTYDNISVPGGLGAGDFTVEGWVYFTVSPGNNGVFQIGSGGYLPSNGTNAVALAGYSGPLWHMYLGPISTVQAGSNILTNQWYHFAICRASGSSRLFINGTQVQQTYADSNDYSTATYLSLGGYYSSGYLMTGYISNFRILRGTALYTTTFAIPTAPLTPVPNTQVLTAQSNRLIDNSVTNKTVTVATGNTQISPANPFVTPATSSYNTQYSTAFDGTGDYLQTPASSTTAIIGGTGSVTTTSTFTIEGWVYQTTRQSYDYGCMVGDMGTNGSIYWGFGPNASGKLAFNWYDGATKSAVGNDTIALNTWTHIAVSISSGSIKLFVNGILQTLTGTSATTNQSGTFGYLLLGMFYTGGTSYGYYGNISNLRITKSALYSTNFTPSTTPLTASASTGLLTCQNATLIDNSTNAFAITSYADARPVATSPFTMTTSTNTLTSLGSTYFDGTSDYLTLPTNASLGMGSGNFTIEFWMYQTALSDYKQILDIVDGNSTGRLILWVDGGGTLYNLGQNGGARNSTAGGAIKINTWTHVALVRSSGVTKFYINGTQSGSNYTDSTNYTCTTGLVYIGVNSDGSTYPYVGYLSNWRMVKGTAVYTANFLPPQAPLTPVTNTQLLTLQYNGGATNNGFVDQSSFNNIVSRTGNPTQGTFSPFSQTGWSTYLDGSSTYYFPANTALNIGSGAFTIEGWVNIPTGTNNKQFVCGSVLIGAGGYSGSTVGALRYYDGITAVGSASYLIATGNWNHFAIVRENTSTNGFKMYVNGILVYVGTSTANPANADTYIGAVNTSTDLLTGYISNVRWVKGTAVYTTASTTVGTQVFTPSTTPLTAIANTTLLTAQSNRFIDNSPYNFTPTISSAPKAQAYSPFGGVTSVPASYSNYFDGSGDYLQMPDSTAYDFTGDFTMEAWIYPTALPADATFLSQWSSGGWCFIFRVSSNLLTFAYWTGTGSVLTGSSGICTIPINTWSHVAVTRSGSTIRLFVNGVVDTNTATYASTIAGSALMEVGGVDGNNNIWSGYISNVRIVKGQALYTTTFTPSTTPLTTTSQGATASNVSLLTCQSPTMIDNSPNYFTITANGNTKPYAYNPFGITNTKGISYTPSVNGGSMYFDGSGDYLTAGTFAPGTNNFTVDFWFYCTALPGSQGMFYSTPWGGNNFQTYISSDSTIIWQAYTQNNANVAVKLHQWYHVAVVKNGSTGYFYINGVLQNTATLTNSISGTATVGSRGADLYFTGYISDMRASIGSVLYTSNFYPGPAPATPTTTIGASTYASTLLLNGTNGGIIDYHGSNDLETVGNTQLAPQDPYGGSYYSNYFDGSGDYLTVASNAAFGLGTGDYNIECWVYPTVNARQDWIDIYSGSTRLTLYYNGTAIAVQSNPPNSDIITGSSMTLGVWQHIAVSRQSGSTKLFVNGTQVGSTYVTSRDYSSPCAITIGKDTYGSTYVTGYISNIRIVKGTALYTTNFTPSTTPLTTTSQGATASQVSLLTCQSNKFVDNSTNAFTITANGNTAVKSINPFQQNTGKSLYFDGTGDYLDFPLSQTFSQQGAWTLEMWIYPTVASNCYLYSQVTGSFLQLNLAANMTLYVDRSGVGNLITSTNPIQLGVWTYISLVSNGTNVKLYVNGAQSGSTATYSTVTASATTTRIGAYQNSGSAGTLLYNGYIEDLRITKGVARYTTTFTPPTTPDQTK